MAFKRFVSKYFSTSAPALRTWQGGYQLSINAAAREKTGIAPFSFVELYFDEDTGRIGIVQSTEENGRRLNKSGSLTCRLFFQEYGISGRCQWRMIPEPIVQDGIKIWAFELVEQKESVTRNPSPKPLSQPEKAARREREMLGTRIETKGAA